MLDPDEDRDVREAVLFSAIIGGLLARDYIHEEYHRRDKSLSSLSFGAWLGKRAEQIYNEMTSS